MRHDRLPRVRDGSILVRKRFQFAGALVVGALLPWLARGPILPGELFEALEEYRQAVRAARERGDYTLALSKKTQEILSSLPHRLEPIPTKKQ